MRRRPFSAGSGAATSLRVGNRLRRSPVGFGLFGRTAAARRGIGARPRLRLAPRQIDAQRLCLPQRPLRRQTLGILGQSGAALASILRHSDPSAPTPTGHSAKPRARRQAVASGAQRIGLHRLGPCGMKCASSRRQRRADDAPRDGEDLVRWCSSGVEHVLGKDGVGGSIPLTSTSHFFGACRRCAHLSFPVR